MLSKTEKFMARYDMTMVDSSRKIPIASKFHIEHYMAASSTGEAYPVEYDYDTLVTLTVPRSRLDALAKIEMLFYGNFDSIARRDLFENWLNQQNEECKLRARYTAVGKAYENYQALLDWCGQTHRRITDIPPDFT